MNNNFRYKYNMICIQNIEKDRKQAEKKMYKNYVFHNTIYEICKKKLIYNIMDCKTYNYECKCINCRLLLDYLKETYQNKRLFTEIEQNIFFKYQLQKLDIETMKSHLTKQRCFFCSKKDICINIDNFYSICNKCFIFL